MKKTYIKPVMNPNSLLGKESLLAGSFVENLGTTEVDGFYALSRHGDSFWDDKE